MAVGGMGVESPFWRGSVAYGLPYKYVFVWQATLPFVLLVAIGISVVVWFVLIVVVSSCRG